MIRQNEFGFGKGGGTSDDEPLCLVSLGNIANRLVMEERTFVAICGDQRSKDGKVEYKRSKD